MFSLRKVIPGTFCSSLEWKVLTFPGAPDFLFMAEEYLARHRTALLSSWLPSPDSCYPNHLLHECLEIGMWFRAQAILNKGRHPTHVLAVPQRSFPHLPAHQTVSSVRSSRIVTLDDDRFFLTLTLLGQN